MSSTLDLGSLIGTVVLETKQFNTAYTATVRKFAAMADQAKGLNVEMAGLDRAFMATAEASAAVDRSTAEATAAFRSAGLSASSAAAATRALTAAQAATVDVTTEAGLAQSKLTQATLRSASAQARLETLQASGKATAAQLAAAQASLIAANDRVTLSNERVAESSTLSARGSAAFRDALAAIPGPAKAAVAAIMVAAGVGVDLAAHFQDATKRIQTQAGESAQQVQALSRGMLSMAGSVATTPTVLADAAYHIASMGKNSLTTAQQLQVLRVAAEGAKIGGADLTDVTNALDAAVVSGIKGAKNYSAAMGALNATVGAGDMTMQNLADALSTRVLTAAKAAGLSITDVGAALAVFGDNNQRGTVAATRFAQAISLMQAPTDKAKAALASIGITATQLGDDMRKPQGLLVALTDLSTHLTDSGKTATEQAQVISAAFGGSRTSGSVLLLLQQLTRLQGKYGDVSAGAKTFSQDWDAYTKTFSFAADRVKAAAEAMGIAIGNKVLPDLTKAVGWFGTSGVDDLDKFGHALAANSMLTGGFADIESAVGHVADSIRNVIVAAEPAERALLELGGGTVLVAFSALAAILDGVTAAVDDVTGFFKRDQTAADALAVVLIARLAPAILATAGEFAAMTATGLASFFLRLSASVGGATSGIRDAEGASGKLGAVFATTAGKASLVGAAAVALYEGSKALGGLLNHTTVPSVDAFTAALVSLGTGSGRSGQQLVAFVRGIAEMQGPVDLLGKSAPNLSTALSGLVTSGHADEAATSFARISATLRQAGMSTAAITKLFPGYETALAESATSAQAAGTGIDQYGNAVSTAAKKTQAATKAAQNYADKLHALADPLFAESQALSDLSSKQDAYSNAVKKYGANSAQARSALEDLASSSLDVEASSRALTAAVEDGSVKLSAARKTLRGWAADGLITQHQADAIVRSWGGLIDKAGKISPAVGGAAKGLEAGTDKMAAAAQRDVARVLAALKHGAAAVENAGVDFSSGFAAGITKGQAKAIHAAAVMGALSYQAAKNAIQAKSPSKLMFAVGVDFVHGFWGGIVATTPQATAAAAAMAADAANAARKVAATIRAAVAPDFGTQLSGLLAGGMTPGALGQVSSLATSVLGGDIRSANTAQQTADVARAQYLALKDAAGEAAANAKALDKLAKSTDSASSSAKAATAAEKASSAALKDQATSAAAAAKAADNAATHAANAASKGQAAWQKAKQAADSAAQAAATDAQSLIQSLSDAATSFISQVSDFESQISQGIAGDYSLTTIWQSLIGTDDQGNPINPTLSEVQSTLDGILAQAKKFSADLNSLLAEGAGQDLITQLAGMGSTAGDELAQQLLAAGPGAVAAMQTTLAGINSTATNEAQLLGKAFFSVGASLIEQMLEGLEKAFPSLKAALGSIIKEIQGEFAAAAPTAAGVVFGSPGPPTDAPPLVPFVPPGAGKIPGFASGVRGFGGGLAWVGEHGPELVKLPAGSNVYPHGSDGASLMDMSGVTDQLKQLNARVDRLADATGAAVGAATLTGYQAAGKAQADRLKRLGRKA